MRVSSTHIAGIGVSGLEDTESSGATIDELAISAATKALLDAGITYNDIDQSIACSQDEHTRLRRSCLEVFGMKGAPICEADNHSGLFMAVQCIRSGQSNCALLVSVDQV